MDCSGLPNLKIKLFSRSIVLELMGGVHVFHIVQSRVINLITMDCLIQNITLHFGGYNLEGPFIIFGKPNLENNTKKTGAVWSFSKY